MRWLFVDPANLSEVASRGQVVGNIDAWWQAFLSKTEDLSALFKQKAKWDLPAWMEQNLGSIDSRLMWEFGPAVNGTGHRLVITPESEHHLRPIVGTILKRAPAIEGWEFYEHRLAEDLEQARRTVLGRTGRDVSDFTAQVTIGEQNRIDLAYSSPSIKATDDHEAFNAAFVTTESLLGEKILNDWIGAIEIQPARGQGLLSMFGGRKSNVRGQRSLEGLKETVDALIGSIREQLPPQPHHEWVGTAEWTIWQLQPEEAADYVGQTDLFVGKSANPAFWTAAHGGGVFCSERFSNRGETFCYLKIDGSEGLEDSEFSDKSEIEDALDALLIPKKIGCQIGGGTGLRYSYIDLALVDLKQGLEAVRNRLRQGRIPKRSWIQFFDSALAAEWVGIHEDTPPPPSDLD